MYAGNGGWGCHRKSQGCGCMCEFMVGERGGSYASLGVCVTEMYYRTVIVCKFACIVSEVCIF